SYVPLRMQVYDALREAILSGRLNPGDHLTEEKVCSQLGVSRSPLREALRRLETEGLVRIEPRRGVVVTELSQGDLADLFAVRKSLEGLATALAAKCITAEELAKLREICAEMGRCIDAGDVPAVPTLNSQYHEVIILAARNRWLKGFMVSLRDHIQRIYSSSIQAPDRASQSLKEHLQINEALCNRDAEAAERLAKEHLQHAEEVAVLIGHKASRGSD
ncbi:MAG: GntR family transcriptional regulator, partial [Chloroflexi bacterium]|nr:GntR family transcriptional regulator [Chloroflexota bacterium]